MDILYNYKFHCHRRSIDLHQIYFHICPLLPSLCYFNYMYM